MARTRTRRRPSTPTAATRPGVATARQLQGKELSYNNINDTDAAFELVGEFDPADGAGLRDHQARQPLRRGARRDACARPTSARFDCDRTRAFGGIVALNRPLDARDRARRSPRSSPRW